MSEKMVPITGLLTESLYKALVALARKRGISANTVLQQAVQTEKYLDEKEEAGGSVLIEERPGGPIKRVIRETPAPTK